MSCSVYGDFNENYIKSSADIQFTFYPEEFSIGWNQVGQFSNFLSAYFSQKMLNCSNEIARDITNTVAYTLNELFENTIKFNQSNEVLVAMRIIDHEIVFVLDNIISAQQSIKFCEYLSYLTDEETDTIDLFVQKVEENVEQGTDGSGLGFLTLINDYSAIMGWKLTALEETESTRKRVSTMARLPITT